MRIKYKINKFYKLHVKFFWYFKVFLSFFFKYSITQRYLNIYFFKDMRIDKYLKNNFTVFALLQNVSFFFYYFGKVILLQFCSFFYFLFYLLLRTRRKGRIRGWNKTIIRVHLILYRTSFININKMYNSVDKYHYLYVMKLTKFYAVM